MPVESGNFALTLPFSSRSHSFNQMERKCHKKYYSILRILQRLAKIRATAAFLVRVNGKRHRWKWKGESEKSAACSSAIAASLQKGSSIGRSTGGLKVESSACVLMTCCSCWHCSIRTTYRSQTYRTDMLAKRINRKRNGKKRCKSKFAWQACTLSAVLIPIIKKSTYSNTAEARYLAESEWMLEVVARASDTAI